MKDMRVKEKPQIDENRDIKTNKNIVKRKTKRRVCRDEKGDKSQKQREKRL